MKLGRKINYYILSGLAFFEANTAHAQDAGPFDKVTDRGSELVEIFAGPIAKMVGTLVIIVVAALWAAGRMSALWAVRIGLAALLVASAEDIMGFLFDG